MSIMNSNFIDMYKIYIKGIIYIGQHNDKARFNNFKIPTDKILSFDTINSQINVDMTKYNFIEIDITENNLKQFDSFFTIVDYICINLYDNCIPPEEIDSHIKQFHLIRTITKQIQNKHICLIYNRKKNIYYTGWLHPKNEIGLKLCDNNICTTKKWNGENDGLVMCTDKFDLTILNTNKKVVYGPHIDFDIAIDFLKKYDGDKIIYYNVLSQWQKELFEKYANNNKVVYVKIPFAVDISKFRPENKENKFFIYYKNVHQSKLLKLLKCIDDLNITSIYDFELFIYGKYKEDDYLNYIKKCKFGIWVGCHESQGFAFEEALSCGCPLFVYDANSLRDEYNITTKKYPWKSLAENNIYPATTASYFNELCGIICKNDIIIDQKLSLFINNLDLFSPREFVINNLSVEKIIADIFTIFWC